MLAVQNVAGRLISMFKGLVSSSAVRWTARTEAPFTPNFATATRPSCSVPRALKCGASARDTIGDTPATLYLLVETSTTFSTSAVAAGAQVRMPVTDMFWGDRCAEIADTEGNKWMIATHKSEPTVAQMQAAMRQMMSQAQPGQESASSAASVGGSDGFGSEY